MKYSFEKIRPFANNEFVDYLIDVDPPYDHISLFSAGGHNTSDYIKRIIEGITKVISGEFKDGYSFGNQSGFQAVVVPDDPTASEYPKAGVLIYDDFGGPEPLYQVPIDEMLTLLKDFKKFLEDNGR